MRLAIYARYSSDKQNPKSSEDQIRGCRKFAKTNNWNVLPEHIYSDDAISGSRSDRPSYQRLLKIIKDAERTKLCPFDGVLVEDSSRLWRDQAEQATAMKVFNSVGVRVLGCDGLDTGSGSGNLLLTFKGVMAEEYLKELAIRTRRGLQSAALEGSHTGGRCFGYDSVPLPTDGNSKRRPSKLIVNGEQAEVVKRIFRMYADGNSLKTIAKAFNAEGVTSPQPRPGRPQTWCPTGIRVILHNERYRGVVIFGKTRKHKKSDDKRIQRPGLEDAKVKREFPEQRIVSDDLWNAVQKRIAAIKAVYGERGRFGGLAGNGESAGNPYLLSGLLRCSECGRNLVLVSGRGKHHADSQYGCTDNANRGTCKNDTRIRRDVLETQLLAYLQSEVLKPEVIEYALCQFEAQLTKSMKAVTGQMADLDSKRRKVEKELANFMRAIASGAESVTIRNEIADREKELQRINAQIVSAKPDSVRTKIQDARKLVEANMKDIKKLFGVDASAAKMTLAKYMPQIVLKPATKDGRKIYQVISQWELLDGTLDLPAVEKRMVGAEGQS
jgi:site-specific DNA recombinase